MNFSPKSYLTDLVQRNLSDWFDEKSLKSIDIGLLDGDLRLSNLSQTWKITQELSLSLKAGTIESLVIQIPWTQIYTGSINLIVENPQLAFELGIVDPYDESAGNTDSFAHDFKMSSLIKEELRLLDSDSTGSQGSWISKYFQNIADSFMSRLISNAKLSIKNLKLSVLVPYSSPVKENSNYFKSANYCLSLQSLDLRKVPLSTDSHKRHSEHMNEYFVSKDIQIHGATITLSKVETPVEEQSSSFYISVLNESSLGSINVLMHPLDVSAQIWGKKEKEAESIIKNMNALVVRITIPSIEFIPTSEHLFIMRDCVLHVSSEIVKNRFQKIRFLRSFIVGVKLHTPRDRWMFAINCILLLIKKHKQEANNITMRNNLVRLGFRREYIKLYKRILLYKLGMSGIPDNAKAFYVNGLTNEEDSRLHAFHEFFPLNDLLLFRLSVHQELQNKGFDISVVKNALLRNKNKSYWSSEKKKSEDKASVDKKRVLLSSNSNGESETPSDFSFKFHVSIPKISVTILDVKNSNSVEKCYDSYNLGNTRKLSSSPFELDSQTSDNGDVKQKVSFAVYGIYCGGEIASEKDVYFSFSAGAIKLFGVHGEEVISCGLIPKHSFDEINYESQSYKGNHDLAIYLSYQSCITSNTNACNFSLNNADEGIDNFMSPEKLQRRDLERNKSKVSDRMFFAMLEASKLQKTHSVVEFMVGMVTFNWSKSTLQFLIELYTHLIPPAPDLKANPFAYYRHLAASLSCHRFIQNEPSKLSLDASMQGFVLSIMYTKTKTNSKSNEERNLPRQRSSTHYKTTIDLSNDSFSEVQSEQLQHYYLQFSIKRMILQAGDYLQDFATSGINFGHEKENSKEKKEKPYWKTEIPEVLKKLYNQQNLQNFQPMMVHISDMQLSFIESHKDGDETVKSHKYLTKVPWSIYGAISFNKSDGDVDSDYLKADLSCTSLKLTLSTQYIIQVIDIANEIVSVAVPLLAADKVDDIVSAPPRVRRLSHISISLIDFLLETLEIEFHRDGKSKISSQSLVSSILNNYKKQFVARGEFSFVTITKHEIALQQLINLGFSKENAKKMLLAVKNSINDKIDVEFNSDESLWFSESMMKECNYDSFDILFNLKLQSVTITENRLMYDSKILFNIKEAMLFDSECNPILCLSIEPKLKLEDFSHIHIMEKEKKETEYRNAHPNKYKSSSSVSEHSISRRHHHKQINKCYLTSVDHDIEDYNHRMSSVSKAFDIQNFMCNSFVFLYVEKDYNEIFGEGGGSVKLLYEESKDQKISKRETDMTVSLHNVECLLSSTCIVSIIDQLIAAVTRVKQHYFNTLQLFENQYKIRHNAANYFYKTNKTVDNFLLRNIAVSRKMLLDKEVEKTNDPPKNNFKQQDILHLNLRLNIKSLSVLLLSEQNFLAKCTIESFEFDGKDLYNFSDNLQIKSSIKSVRVFDLSDFSVIHSEIVWKNREKEETGLVTARIIRNTLPGDPPFCFSLDITGLRVCFLCRFFIDVIDFLNIGLIGQMSSLFQQVDDERIKNAAFIIAQEDNISNIVDDNDDLSMSNKSDLDSLSYYSDNIEENSVNRNFFENSSNPSDSNEFNFSNVHFESQTKTEINNERNPANDKSEAGLEAKKDENNSLENYKLFNFRVGLHDFNVILPRNSNSFDLVAITVDKAVVQTSNIKNSWSVPVFKSVDPSDDLAEHEDGLKYPLHFDTFSNKLRYKTSTKKETFDDFNMPDEHALKTDYLIKKTLSSVTEGNEEEEAGSHNFSEKTKLPSSNFESSTFQNPKNFQSEDSDENDVIRVSLCAENINIFTSLSVPLKVKSSSESLQSFNPNQHKLFAEIHDSRPVNDFKHKVLSGKGNNWSKYQSWHKISNNDFNICIVTDFTPDQMRILITDTDSFSDLNLIAAQSELYLLFSLWFENLNEISQFPLEAKAVQIANENKKNNIKESGNQTKHHTLDQIMAAFKCYGTKEYIKFLLNRENSFELVFIRSEIRLECLIDCNYFSKDIPSYDFLSNVSRVHYNEILSNLKQQADESMNFNSKKNWVHEVIPIANIFLSGFFMHLKFDYDTIRMCCSAGEIRIEDARKPNLTLHPIILKASPKNRNPNRRIYGYSDFNYGFNMNPSDASQSQPIPLQVSFVKSTITNWMTVNVGLDNLDLNMINMDLIWLVSEYISCYFRFVEFGNPTIPSFEKLPKDAIPYGGIDARLFFSNPYISLIKSPLKKNSPLLQIEATKGIFYRYILDNNSSVKMDLKIYDLCMVLLKSYCEPSLARGMRGASGTGKGVRTLLEFLNLALSYHFNFTDDHLNILLDINNFVSSNSNTNDNDTFRATNTSFVDLDSEELKLKPAEVPHPFCVFPLNSSNSSKFNKDSCDIVTCYDDIDLCTNLINTFLKIKSNKEEHKSSVKLDEVNSSMDDQQNRSTALCSLYSVMCITGFRIMIVDNVLGLHLPLLQIFSERIDVTYDRQKNMPSFNFEDIYSERRYDKAISTRLTKSGALGSYGRPTLATRRPSQKTVEFQLSMFPSMIGSPSIVDGDVDDYDNEEEPQHCDNPISALGKLTFWVQYFNNMVKCWEPLIDKITAFIMYEVEDSNNRGTGFILKFNSAIHIYISVAFIQTLYNFLLTIQKVPFDDDADFSLTKNFSVSRASNFDEVVQIHMYGSETVDENVLAKNKFGRGRGSISVGKNHTIKINPSNNHFHPNEIEHVRDNLLGFNDKVGFSLKNLTGQPLRYLQQWDGGKKTVQYLDDKERGLLNFVPCNTIIRNYEVIEETFDVQMDLNNSRRSRKKTRVVGNKVSVQIAGYKWLHDVQADDLGIKHNDLKPCLGRYYLKALYPHDWKIDKATKLVSEVVPHCGGRMLILRSVFIIKNNTKHSLRLLANDEKVNTKDENASSNDKRSFTVESNSSFNVPLCLMRRTALATKGQSLGLLYIAPIDMSPIMDELGGRPHIQAGSVDYSTDPIDLYKTMDFITDNNTITNDGDSSRISKSKNKIMQIVCNINPKDAAKIVDNETSLNSNLITGQKNKKEKHLHQTHHHSLGAGKFPPFCYNIEVLHHSKKEYSESEEFRLKSLFVNNIFRQSSKTDSANHLQYTLVIHPPIIIENLLPTGAIFEILHAEKKTVLWSSWLEAGTAKPIHSVLLDQPLVLVINLKYCRTPDGLLFHSPPNASLFSIENIVDGLDSTEAASVILFDTVGQKLRLKVENNEGGGGQRHLVVYCPFWIVNTTQFSFRIREEGRISLPAGTVTSQKDGTRPVPISSSVIADMNSNLIHLNQDDLHRPIVKDPFDMGYSEVKMKSDDPADKKASNPFLSDKGNVVFPGKCGPLHTNNNKEISYSDSHLRRLLSELTFEELVQLSYMYNYTELSSYLIGYGSRKVKIQLDDSDWSLPFCLDTVEFKQQVSINHKNKGIFEVGYKITNAPGRLSKYTKIVRFLPLYTITNKTTHLLKILQPTGFSGEMLETEVSSLHIKPYHLPAIFGERKVALQIDGPWNRTVPISLNDLVASTLEVKRYIDLASIQHVNTRGAPEYSVILPGRNKLGVYFETDWGEENIVVKALQVGSFAAKETDIQVGDVLISIDDVRVGGGNNFDRAMELLKSKIYENGPGCVVVFRTVEEKVRLIRDSALNSNPVKRQRQSVAMTTQKFNQIGSAFINKQGGNEDENENLDNIEAHNERILEELRRYENETIILKVEKRQIESSISIVINEITPELNTSYRIENKSISYVMFYKQQGISGNKWRSLFPGQSCSYVWEDPFAKPLNLQLLAGMNVLSPTCREDRYLNKNVDKTSILNNSYWDYLARINIEQLTAVIDFDKIGSDILIPLPNVDAKMSAYIKSEGPSKILTITPVKDITINAQSSFRHSLLEKELNYANSFISEQMNSLEAYKEELEGFISINSNEQNSEGVVPSFSLLDESRRQKVDVLKEFQTSYLEKNSYNIIKSMSVNHLSNISLSPTINLNSNLKDFGQQQPATNMSLVSFQPIENLFESSILTTGRLYIEVLEAKELVPSVYGKLEEVYCKLSFKYRKSSFKSLLSNWNRVYNTYVCDQTLDPSWLDQNFLFEVPEKAVKDPRSFILQLLVKSKYSIGVDQVLGRMDLNISCLKDEKMLEGWFPLRPAHSTLIANNISGSIKLRLQWIHSTSGLAKYYLKLVKRRLLELKLQRNIISFTMKKNNSEYKFISKIKDNLYFKQDNFYDLFAMTPIYHSNQTRKVKDSAELVLLETDLEEQVSRSEINSEIATTDIKTEKHATFKISSNSKRTPNSIISNNTSIDRKKLLSGRMKTVSKISRDISIDDESEIISKPESSIINTVFLKPIMFSHDSNYQNWADSQKNYNFVHNNLSSYMAPSLDISSQHSVFRKRFVEECSRNVTFAHTNEGSIEITPIQLLHLPESSRSIFVRISYGTDIKDSFRMAPAADLNIYHSTDSNNNKVQIVNNDNYYDESQHNARMEDLKEKNESLSKVFPVELLNIKGNINVQIMMESFPKAKPIVSVALQVFNLVECTCSLEPGQYYERWFPLLAARECIQGEGEVDMVYKFSRTEQENYSAFGYDPCILLRCRWIPKDNLSQIQSIAYTRIQIPYCTIGFVDSKKGQEVMQGTIHGVEVSQSETKEKTNFSLNIKWIQIDNELPDSSTQVIFSPTVCKYPQPVVRFYSIQQNHLSQRDLSSYEAVQLVVQEFDLKLEQRTILSSWEFLKSCWEINSSDFFNEIAFNDLSTLGFAFARISSKKQDILSLLTEKLGFSSIPDNKEIDENISKVYIEKFFLSALKLHVSFITSPRMRSQINAKQHQSNQYEMNNERTSSFSIFLWQVGEVVLNLTSTISDAPITFNHFKYDSLFQSQSDIAKTLQDHYVHTALGQLYKIVGSLELVGNPIGAFSSFSSGVHDLFNEPAQAIIHSPTDIPNIGKGVVKGTFSFVTNTTAAPLGFFLSFSQAIARGFSKLTMDPRFMRAREKLQKPPRTIFGLLTRPVKDINYGLFYGVSGVLYIPYLEWQQQSGFARVPAAIRGFGKGVAGGAAKICVGVLDAVAHTLTAVYDTLQIANKNKLVPVLRLRLSDLFGPDGRILPYNFENSLGTNILFVLEQSNDEYVVGNAISGGVGAYKNINKYFRSQFSLKNNQRRKQYLPIFAERRLTKKKSITSKSDARHTSTKLLMSEQKIDDSVPNKLQDREFVINTTIIKRDTKSDSVVIITNIRLVVTLYRRNKNGIPDLSTVWECGIDNLSPPIFERSVGNATLLLSSYNDDRNPDDTYTPFGATSENSESNNQQNRPSFVGGQEHHHYLSYFNRTFLLEGNHNEEELILNLYNCIQTLLGNFESLKDNKSDNNICEHLSGDIISIGSWQYAIDLNAESSGKYEDSFFDSSWDSEEMKKHLEREIWRVKNMNSQVIMSPWLKEEYNLALDSHDRVAKLLNIIRDLDEENESNPKARKIYSQAIDNLKSGHADFDQFMDMIKLFREKKVDIDQQRTYSSEIKFKNKENKWTTAIKNIPRNLMSSIPLINIREKPNIGGSSRPSSDFQNNLSKKETSEQDFNSLTEEQRNSNDSLSGNNNNNEESSMSNLLVSSAKHVGKIVPMIRKSIAMPEHLSLNLSMDYFKRNTSSSSNLSSEQQPSPNEDSDEIFYDNKSIKEDIEREGRSRIPFFDHKSDSSSFNRGNNSNNLIFDRNEDQDQESVYTEDQESISVNNTGLGRIFKKDANFTPILKESREVCASSDISFTQGSVRSALVEYDHVYNPSEDILRELKHQQEIISNSVELSPAAKTDIIGRLSYLEKMVIDAYATNKDNSLLERTMEFSNPMENTKNFNNINDDINNDNNNNNENNNSNENNNDDNENNNNNSNNNDNDDESKSIEESSDSSLNSFDTASHNV